MIAPLPRPVVSLDHGRARVDLNARQLRVDGQPAKLGSRAFDLLVALLERHDRVVSKQELLDVVWPGLVVEENNLQVHVMTLRRLLGTSAIATISGRGYRLTLALTLEAEASASQPAAVAAQPVPAPVPDGLLGRDALIAQALKLLGEDSLRLLTLTGPGGSGKTRLGLRVASLRAAQLDDGAYTVMLAPVRDSNHLMPALAAALGIQESGSTPMAQLVRQFLAPRRLLLLLDNLEHLTDAGLALAALLADCPRLQLLATSRAPLRVGGETLLRVPPLALPDGDSLEQRHASPAVQLFVQRAAASGRDVAASADEMRAAAEICRRVDGLPLAIELAAARLRVLTPAALAARLQQRLPLLTGGAADAPARQQTLRQTIAWSHELLTLEAQRLLRRLAVFVGGWSLDAAEQVHGEAAGCIDALEQLIDHSLVQRVDDVDGDPRYAMLETIREYALEQLAASGEHEAVHERHAQAMLALARSSEPQITSAARRPALLRLRAELNNLRGALGWWLQQRKDVQKGLPLAAALAWPWYFEGLFQEGRAWLEAALALPGATPHDRAAGLTGAARMAAYSARVAQAQAYAQEAVALWRGLDAPRGLAFACLLEGVAHCMAADFAAAEAPLQEVLRLFRALDDPWGIALAMAYLGASLAQRPGLEDAAGLMMMESRARFGALGDPWGQSTSAHYLGSLALQRGDLALARQLGQETLANSRELNDRFRMARNLHQLAEIDLADGRHASALQQLAESLEINIDHGRFGDAAQQLRLLSTQANALGQPVIAAQAAAMAAPHADADRTMPHDDPAVHAALLQALQQQLGPAAWREAWATGAAQPFEQATTLVHSLIEIAGQKPM